ncbi:hypothetical protein BDQ17DRAFT_1260358, partial [Cyathus striatus]
WRPVNRFGVPHATTADDIYKGYFIPKGTSQSSIATTTHDERKYPDPEIFRPE